MFSNIQEACVAEASTILGDYMKQKKPRYKLLKYKVIVEVRKNEVTTYNVIAFSKQEAKYEVMKKEGCLDKDIITVLNTR